MAGNQDYVVVTPVRNEEQYLRRTIDSILAQTVRPKQWVIVNDGSTDRTSTIIDEAAAKYSWIRAVHRADRGYRKSGGGVIEAFYDGYDFVKDKQWDYIVKLDGDLSFEPSYFAACFDRFDNDSKLGIGGGMICGLVNGILEEEAKGDPVFHVRGATKIYSRACWNAIGGLIKSPGWDTLDEVKANMLGWKTYTFRDLKLAHHRYTGRADGSWKNWVKNGRANYIVGYHPLFMLCKCARRMFAKPYGLASAALWYGFITGYFVRAQRIEEPSVIRYLQREQLRRLFLKSSLWASK